MRDIKQILENKNKEKNINNRIDYQKLFESKKIQEEMLLPQCICVKY